MFKTHVELQVKRVLSLKCFEQFVAWSINICTGKKVFHTAAVYTRGGGTFI